MEKGWGRLDSFFQSCIQPPMSIALAVPKETEEGEKRVALVPESAARLVKAGFDVAVEAGAGRGATFSDDDYTTAGARIVSDSRQLFQGADIVVKVQPPSASEIGTLKEDSILVGFLAPQRFPERVALLRDRKITAFAMELIPRITRAQNMDALSSQATVAGYKAALIAANLTARFFPMLTTAAGTIRPVRALVLGAGVAGLQAIATCRRLGAVVEAYDVRSAVKEQVESLGAHFLDTHIDAQAEGGYARELTEDERKREQEMVSDHVARADVVITTAQVPGRQAPRLISEAMVARMKSGSVIVDMAAEQGGNCAHTRAGETVHQNGVAIFGPVNLPSQLAVHASEMYSRNVTHFLLLMTKEGKTLEIDFADAVLAGSVLTHAGEVKHTPTWRMIEEGLQ